MRRLFLARLAERLEAAPAVPQKVTPRLVHPGRNLGVAFERQRTGRNRGRYAQILKHPGQPPDADAAAVFEMRLGAQIAHGGIDGKGVFAPAFAAPMPRDRRILGPFLSDDHKVDGDQGPPGQVMRGACRPYPVKLRPQTVLSPVFHATLDTRGAVAMHPAKGRSMHDLVIRDAEIVTPEGRLRGDRGVTGAPSPPSAPTLRRGARRCGRAGALCCPGESTAIATSRWRPWSARRLARTSGKRRRAPPSQAGRQW
jgi:hypothetical protein